MQLDLSKGYIIEWPSGGSGVLQEGDSRKLVSHMPRYIKYTYGAIDTAFTDVVEIHNPAKFVLACIHCMLKPTLKVRKALYRHSDDTIIGVTLCLQDLESISTWLLKDLTHRASC